MTRNPRAGNNTLYTVKIKFPADYNEKSLLTLSEALFDMSSSSAVRREDGDHQNPLVLEWFCETDVPPPAGEVMARLVLQGEVFEIPLKLKPSDIAIEKLPEQNWLEKVYRELAPFSVGPFYIYGSHVTDPVPEGQIGILIDAATAFGSGEHGTTKGCLQAMLNLKGRGVCPWNVLDMGTGSGILAIGAYKLWHTPVTAVDNDEEAVRVAVRYRDLNKIPESKTGMICAAGDGFRADIVQERKPFDLVIANILAGPLIDMVADLASVSDENGHVILSGMLNEQAESVAEAYEKNGYALKDSITIGKWTTLVLQRNS